MRPLAAVAIATLVVVAASCRRGPDGPPWSGTEVRACPPCRNEMTPAKTREEFAKGLLQGQLACLGETSLAERTTDDARIVRMIWGAGLGVPGTRGWWSSLASATLERAGAGCSALVAREWSRMSEPHDCVVERHEVELTERECEILTTCATCDQRAMKDADLYEVETWTGGHYGLCVGAGTECTRRWNGTLGAGSNLRRTRWLWPDEPEYCAHCPCVESTLDCPRGVKAPCSLDDVERAFPMGPFERCGEHVVFSDPPDDPTAWYAFATDTGKLVGWKARGEGPPTRCSEDYFSEYARVPRGGFVFPALSACETLGPLPVAPGDR
jgi:hypothetical protein